MTTAKRIISGARTRRLQNTRFLFEHLEDRINLTATIFLDFGLGLVNEIAPSTYLVDPLVGPCEEFGICTDPGAGDYHFLPFDITGGSIQSSDVDMLESLQTDAVRVVARAFEPFDVDVVAASATSLAEINANVDEPNDVYAFVGQMLNSEGNSIREVLGTATGTQGNSVVVFAELIYEQFHVFRPSSPFGNFLGSIAAHEAFHTLGAGHTSSPDLSLPVDPAFSNCPGSFGEHQGNAISNAVSFGIDSCGNSPTVLGTDLTTYYPSIVTRFPLRNSVNLYDHAITTLGVSDADLNGKADFAYVTGTGVNDVIEVSYEPATAIINVNVNTSATTGARLNYNYPISLSSFDGKIVIEPGLRDDLVRIDSNVPAHIQIRASHGNDQVEIVGTDSGILSIIFEGEEGNDEIELPSSAQFPSTLFGGAGNDTLLGGAGHDTIMGGTGRDFLDGFGGNDDVWGNEGADRIWTGEGSDTLHLDRQDTVCRKPRGKCSYIGIPFGGISGSNGGPTLLNAGPNDSSSREFMELVHGTEDSAYVDQLPFIADHANDSLKGNSHWRNERVSTRNVDVDHFFETLFQLSSIIE